ncbi:MAG: GrpB family protein [Firmicutes bacterium]|nr:GrpB family protein [Bacillota bacterium]
MREMILVPYDQNWVNLFDQMKKDITDAFYGLAIEVLHIGSTAIIGMPSKPIIDILVVLDSFEGFDQYSKLLVSKGYVFKGEHGIDGRQYFQKFHEDGIHHIAHVHCYQKNNSAVFDHILFRDYLNSNPEAFKKYLDVKLVASKLYRLNPSLYTNHKSSCIQELISEAKKDYKKML